MWGDVYEIIVDGKSGSVPLGTGFPIIIGTSTKGETAKAKLLGPDSDIEEIFGSGNLVEKLKDFFAYSGQNAGCIAVRVASDIQGSAGSISESKTGDLTCALNGTPKINCEIVILFTKEGGMNNAQYKYSIDGGDTFTEVYTLPLTGIITIPEAGLTFTFSGTEAKENDLYSVNCKGNSASITAVVNTLTPILEKYDVEFILITEPTDSSDWAALGIIADSLYNEHKPTFFLTTTRTVNDGESIDDWVEYCRTEKTGFAHPYICAVACFGDVIEANGTQKIRDVSGIIAGIISKARVDQSIAEVDSFPIRTVTLPDNFINAHAKALEELGFITLKKYAGLNNLFVVEGRTLAEPNSDYKHIEALRTIFKTVRLARIKSLPYLKKPIKGGEAGLKAIESDIREYIKNNMIRVIPNEIEDVEVNIPLGQDINNNGLAYDLTIFASPIIRKITIFFRLKIAEV